VSILYTMPYIGLEEPIRAAVDEPSGLQRLDFYDGLNTFIFNASGLRTGTGVKETAIEILPVVDHKDCFAHPTVTSPSAWKGWQPKGWLWRWCLWGASTRGFCMHERRLMDGIFVRSHTHPPATGRTHTHSTDTTHTERPTHTGLTHSRAMRCTRPDFA